MNQGARGIYDLRFGKVPGVHAASSYLAKPRKPDSNRKSKFRRLKLLDLLPAQVIEYYRESDNDDINREAANRVSIGLVPA
jgi:hypothetical protein